MMNGKPVFTVPVKTILNLHSGFEHKLLCDGPTFSTGDACAYRCSFCYVPSHFHKLDRVRELLEAQGLRHEDVVIRREHALDILEKQLVYPDGRPRYPDPEDTRVVYSSPSVDVAANLELVQETIAACRLILKHTHWQIRLLSKSHLLPKIAEKLEDDVPDERARERIIYGVSTGTLNDAVAKVFEEDTPLVSKRIKSLHWLQDQGFRTFGMICPSLPCAGQASYQSFAAGAYLAIRGWECEHVWAEVINVRGESMQRTVKALEAGGFKDLAASLHRVSINKFEWEDYNRATFLAHAAQYKDHPGKLRFLTYVTPPTRTWWETQRPAGAVLLGKA